MHTLIIAEAGVNHNGSLKLAKELALKAKECGADIVKYQTANLDSLVSKSAKMAEYQKDNMKQEMSQKEMLKKLLLSYDKFVELSRYCDEIGIKFLSTPFDVESIDFLESLGCDLWKVPSGEITNYPYLVRIAKTKKPVILSTGMCTMDEVRECVKVLKEHGTSKLTILQCNTMYPTKYEDANVSAMLALKEEFGVEVGYSDHTNGIVVPIMAVALGATVIEKHFTLDKNMEGPDHKASLEPHELKEMVDAVRNAELALGTGRKEPSESERANKSIARKSIVAKCYIKKGELLSEDNLTTKRPGNGINPMMGNSIIGKVSKRDILEDELLALEDLE